MVFAGINSGIPAGALADPFNEGNRLVGAHRAAGIMTILFEIQHEQDPIGTRQWVGLGPCAGDHTEKMIGLPDRIGRVSIMISAPEQTRPSGGLLPCEGLRITIEPLIGCLINNTEDDFALHRGTARTHQIVMRESDYVADRNR